jgi:hypothetical protein
MKPSEVNKYLNKSITVTQKNGVKIHGVMVTEMSSSQNAPAGIDIIDRRHGSIEGRTSRHKVTHYITQRVYVCNIRSITGTPSGAEGPVTDELLNAYRAKTAQGATKAIL